MKCKPSNPNISQNAHFTHHLHILQSQFPNAKISINLVPSSSSSSSGASSASSASSSSGHNGNSGCSTHADEMPNNGNSLHHGSSSTRRVPVTNATNISNRNHAAWNRPVKAGEMSSLVSSASSTTSTRGPAAPGKKLAKLAPSASTTHRKNANKMPKLPIQALTVQGSNNNSSNNGTIHFTPPHGIQQWDKLLKSARVFAMENGGDIGSGSMVDSTNTNNRRDSSGNRRDTGDGKDTAPEMVGSQDLESMSQKPTLPSIHSNNGNHASTAASSTNNSTAANSTSTTPSMLQNLPSTSQQHQQQNSQIKTIHIQGTRKQLSYFISEHLRIEMVFESRREVMVAFLEEKVQETLRQLENVWNELYPAG